MRYLALSVIAVTVAGCAAQLPTQKAAAREHAANIAAAKDAGYTVVPKNGQTMFCPTHAPIGSHLTTCLTEREWRQEQASVYSWKVVNAPEPFTVTTREGY